MPKVQLFGFRGAFRGSFWKHKVARSAILEDGERVYQHFGALCVADQIAEVGKFVLILTNKREMAFWLSSTVD